MRLFLFALLCLPLIEIAVLIMVGSNIGVMATIGLVIFTGLLGSYLLRSQGITALSKLRNQMESGRAPDKQLADAAMIVVAGVFLIIPGFLSDLIGILLFVPVVRKWIVKTLARKVRIVRPASRNGETVVDLGINEYHRTDNDAGRPDRSNTSPWQLPSDT